MKLFGMERPVDKLGRVVIPREIRKNLQMVDGKDSFDIYFENDSIILKKHQEQCVFCGETENLTEFSEHLICPGCLAKLKEVE